MTDDDAHQSLLFDEALDLVIRLQSDPRNAIARDTAKRWRARSPAHQQAWRRAMEVHVLTGALMGRSPSPTAGRRLFTRRSITTGIAAAATVSAAAVFGPDLLLRAQADYISGAGELRRIALPDGSVATLGPRTALALGFAPAERRLDLLAGMVFVDVVADRRRPFRIATDAMVATAVGTAFDVSRDDGSITVCVQHGAVDIAAGAPGAGTPATGAIPTGAAAAETLSLQAGQWATIQPGGGRIERGTREIADIGTWRTGTLVVDDEAIGTVVARISRWTSGRVIVADPALGSQRVSGVYALNDPIRALEAVVRPYGGHVRQIAGLLTVISPV